MNQQIDLAPEEALWLRQHGDRDASHVFVDETLGRYIYMDRADRSQERIFLPKVGI